MGHGSPVANILSESLDSPMEIPVDNTAQFDCVANGNLAFCLY